MSLFETMRTSVGGMNAQSTLLGSVGQNIANSSTVGYKNVDTQFETMMGAGYLNSYALGGVSTVSRDLVTQQGSLTASSSVTDLAIQGSGFFITQDPSGQTTLTRAGSFTPDSNGRLVNTAGLTLMGYSLANSAGAATTASLSQLVPITLNQTALSAAPTTAGSISANLNSNATIVAAADLPSTNSAGAQYTSETSLTAYDSLGAPVSLNVYYAKSGTGQWEASVYDASQAASGGGFPYASGPLAVQTLSFDSSGQLTTSPTQLSIAVPNGSAMTLDMGSTTQLAATFSVTASSANGSAPVPMSNVSIDQKGIVSAVYQNGQSVRMYQIPLGSVASADHLQAVNGDAFLPTSDSGQIVIGNANTAGSGSIISSALESSTVDLATELTTMIESQRNYSANSKVFQASADMLGVLMNVKV